MRKIMQESPKSRLRIPMPRKAVAGVFVLALALLVPACGDDSQAAQRSSARMLANDFHEAVLSGNVRKMLDLVDYPFHFDGRRKELASEIDLKAVFEKERHVMREAVRPATVTEIVTYDELLGGKEFAGLSLKKDQAIEQAGRVHLERGGLIVRCYHEVVDKETGARKTDGRAYYLVMHPSALGDLKVTTYYD
jgi:hypothetical protein